VTAKWKSQTFDAEGSTTAPGILRQLGRPSLDEFTILVREAAQNSWDARRDDSDVDFAVHLDRLGDRATKWKSLLCPGPDEESIPGFESGFDSDSWFVVVSDRGTHGLGGPVRATERPATTEKNDFVQFLRNVGEPRDSALGGGTYGFGKGIFYRTSRVRTIVADSRIIRNGVLERRIMGAALGNDYYDSDDVRFTGRHWWGKLNDGIVDPLVGQEAEDVARTLGLPNFEDSQTGSNIVVLAADLGLVGGESDGALAEPEALGAHLASAMLWNLWPKFRSVAPEGQFGMNFAVSVQGSAIDIPSPLEVAALRPFVKSFVALGGSKVRAHRRSADPKIEVGELVVTESVAPMTEGSVTQSARPFETAPHHVALMRQAGLVVDYLAGPPHPDATFCYGGVFQSSELADEYFAAAEPPTHDGWNPEGLPRDARLVVQGALRFVRGDLVGRFASRLDVSTKGGARGLGHGSRRLASLVAGIRATGADPVGSDVQPGGPGTGGAGARTDVRMVGDPWVESSDGGLLVFARIRIEDPEGVTSVRAWLDVVLDGGSREGAPPRGATTPRVLRWVPADGTNRSHEGEVVNGLDGVQDWLVIAEFSDDAVTRFSFAAERAVPGGA
jgi:hypothetical protein